MSSVKKEFSPTERFLLNNEILDEHMRLTCNEIMNANNAVDFHMYRFLRDGYFFLLQKRTKVL